MKRASKYKPYPDYKDSGIEWVGDFPEHWESSKARYHFSFGKGLSITKANLQETGIPCVNYGEVHSKYGFEVDPSKHPLKCVDEHYLATNRQALLKNGDLIFADTSEDIEGSGNFTQLISDHTLFAGYHTVIARPYNRECSRFYAYLFEAKEWRVQIQHAVKGVKVFSITQAILKETDLWFPPIEERHEIVSFLDRETEKIDRLLSKQERQIALLDEKRQALITDAVLGKIDIGTFNYSAMPKTDSGIPTIGTIPKHWKVERAKRCVAQVDDRSETGTEELLTVSHLTGVTSRRDKNVNMFLAESLEGYKKCKPGDLIINTMWAWMGALGVSRQEGIVSPSYHVYRPILPYDFQWLEMFSRTKAWVQEMTRYSKGVWSSRLRLYPDAFLAMSMPVPPLEEQKAIVEYVNANLEKTDKLKTKLTRSIELLKERRTAIISAAVTGKIDVREM